MPKGIRPTQNKVRKAVFDILGDIEGLSFLELFAGSGAVGFEALSRGAASLTLVEPERESLQAIRRNIESLGITDCSLIPLDSESAIRLLHKEKKSFEIIFLDPPYYKKGTATPNLKAPWHKGLPSASSMDRKVGVPPSASTPNPKGWVGVPPSASTPNPKGWVGVPPSASKKALQMLGAYDILAPIGLVVVQHFKRDELPRQAGKLSLVKQARYGDTVISIYRKEA